MIKFGGTTEPYPKPFRVMDLEQIKNRLDLLDSEVASLKSLFEKLNASTSRKGFEDRDLIEVKSRLERLNSLEEQFITLRNENERLRNEINMIHSNQMQTVSTDSLAILSSRIAGLEKKIKSIEKICEEPKPVIME